MQKRLTILYIRSIKWIKISTNSISEYIECNCGKHFLLESVLISCGGDILSSSCSLCPKSNETSSNKWCAGMCYFDEKEKMCKEGNNFTTKILTYF